MDFEELRYQEIEDYLKGKLSETDRISFEEAMSSNSQLAQEVAVQKVALKSLEMAYMQSMSELVRNRVQKNNALKKYWFGGGAILLTGLLVGGSYLISTHTEETAPDKTNIEFIDTIKNIKKYNIPENISNTITVKEDKTSATHSNTVGRIENASTPLIDSSLLTKAKINASIAHSNNNTKHISPDEKTEIINSINAQTPTTKSSCPDNVPEVSVRVTPTSFDEHSGSIHINIPSNWKVYLKGANSSYENKNQFEDLAAGTYVLFVQNESQCNFQIGSYSVTNSNCSFEKNYVFNKQFDKDWNIPTVTNSSYKVIILNKGGIEVFSENVAAHNRVTWNGLNKNGENVAIGLHKVIITYSDNKTCIYNVVVSE